MCGIVGSFNFTDLSEQDLSKMCESISHRGPDNTGFFFDKINKVAFGHLRLSILDVRENANQPMKSNNGRYLITYNGEIYNYKKIREKIDKENKNINLTWQTTSDTEVLVNAIQFYGLQNTLAMLEGMYAFAIYDKLLNKITLCIDKIGEKPLYYFLENNQLFFSSDLKAFNILKKKIKFSINKDSVSQFIKYGFICAPYTIYNKIFKIEPSQYIEVTKFELKKNYYDKTVEQEQSCNVYSKTDYVDKLNSLLTQSVSKMLNADVPVGCFISGGIDSSLVSAIASKQKNNIDTFTIFDSNDNYHDQSKTANSVAKYIGSNHHEVNIKKEDILNFVTNLHCSYAEPFADSSQIPSFLLSKFAKKKVKVCLSGDGADEIFGGYNRYAFYKNYYKFLKKIPFSIFENTLSNKIEKVLYNDFFSRKFPRLNKQLPKILSAIKIKKDNDYYDYLLSHCNLIYKDVLKNNKVYIDKVRTFQIRSFKDLMDLDKEIYLPNDILVKVDRASMYHSLEVRCPYLDTAVVNFMSKLNNNDFFIKGKTKFLLREVAKKYFSGEFFNEPKKGFSIPLEFYLRTILKEWAENLLTETNLKKHDYFNINLVQKLWNSFLKNSNNSNNCYGIWNILVFQNWFLKNDHLLH
jgi:asparagine synthase (glutamine-hydrolysing)